MIRTGVFTAVARERAGPALGWAMFLTLLMGSSVSVAGVLNPSFERTRGTLYSPLPQNWYDDSGDTTCFNSYCTNSWKTDGNLSVELLSLRSKPITSGKYRNFYQESVDLTGIATIKFDVRLYLSATGPFAHFEASFLVDGVPLWKQTVGGVYLDQEVNVAGLKPRRAPDGRTLFGHRIEVRITALDSGTFGPNYYTLWDNVRLIEGLPTIPAAIALDPGTLNLASNGNWITCYIELPKDAESGKTYDVGTIDGASVALQCGDNPDPILAYTGDQGWATAAANADNVADFDGDGVLERMVKFDRAAVQALVQPPEATVSIQGELANGSILFEGKAVIRVLDNKAQKQ